MEDSELLKKRLTELSKRSRDSLYFQFTDFLGLAEQSVFAEVKRELKGDAKYTAFGGASGAERIMIRFGDEEELGYSEPFPIKCIKIEPVAPKFADRLTHRDFLGALLNLGIERSRLGDIPIIDNVGYLFCKDDIADFILNNLTRVRRTEVKLSIIEELPEGEMYKTEKIRVQAVGERVDALVAKIFSLSRDESLSYFKKRLVFVDGRLCENNSYIPKSGEIISVRGLGRFRYIGPVGTTKKGKLNIEVDKYC